VLLDGAYPLDQVIDFLRKAGDVLHGQFEGFEVQANVFEFGADVSKAHAHLSASVGEVGVHFFAETYYARLDAGDFGFIVGDVAAESGKSPLD
jgi:hypothetical protein